MEYKQRSYPFFSACGLNCGLCPRHHTDGGSKCPGCAGEGFSAKHPSCGVLSCSQRRGLEYCFECSDYPCKKYDGADNYDSFITHKNQLSDMEKARNLGSEAYKAELDKKIPLLTELLKGYDDGRRKSFFCLAVNLLELSELGFVLERLEVEAAGVDGIAERAALAAGLLQAEAESKHVTLKLRKKPKP